MLSQHLFNEVTESDIGCIPDCEDRDMRFEKTVLQIIKETTEVLDEINWQPHRLKNTKTISRDYVVEELIDVFKFWLNLCLLYNVKPQEIYDVFMAKTVKVEEKLRKQFEGQTHA